MSNKPVWPFPSQGQVKPIDKWQIGNEIARIEQKAKRNEEKQAAEEARKQLGEAPL